jgi:uncharacterized protein (DUF885 family)
MSNSTQDALTGLEHEIVEHFFALRPSTALGLGDHAYDGVLPDLSRKGTDRWSKESRTMLDRLAAVAERDLPRSRQLDRQLLRLLLEGALFDLEDARELDRNPMSYLFVPNLTDYMIRAYAPAAERVASIVRILEGTPAIFEDARARLESPLPRPFVTLSVQIAGGMSSHFGEAEAFARAESAELADFVHRSRERAEAAIASFADWLKTDQLPRANEDFVLGRERFQRLLWVREGLSTPVETVLEQGLADLRRNQDRLAEIARKEGTSVDLLLSRLNDDHPTSDELIGIARRVTEETREFVRRQDLVTIPEPEHAEVRDTPEWAHDLWTAAMSSPGPFESAVDGIYWVTNVDPEWTPQQREEWMRTFNYSMIRNTTVHEVWPGHYLQSLHTRQPNQTLARKAWFSFSFVEGWAHYCEQVALEAGFEDRSAHAEAAQLRDALIRDGRLVVSIRMHTQGLSVTDAATFLRTEAHLEQLHAEREAIRGTYNPEYFCYTLGKLAILDVRTKYLQSKFGSSLKRFHDALLSHGSPPIGMLDTLMSTS